MYIIQEIQAQDNAHVALLPAVTKETREEAESAFYMICGAAVTLLSLLIQPRALLPQWHWQQPAA